MSVVIHVPALLRRLTGGRDEVQVGGRTVRDALAELAAAADGQAHPLAAWVGTPSRLHVFVNGEDVGTGLGLGTPLRDGDEVALIPAIAGGR